MSADGCPALWTDIALAPPRAHGMPLPLAGFKTVPEDFRVEEQLSFVPSGEGPHWLLRVEKRASNTGWVAAALAGLAGVAARDVGFAGLKDRQAVAVQWFSVPATHPADHWRGVRTPQFDVLEVHGNARKLKRGALAGNRFRIRLRSPGFSIEDLERKLDAIRASGVPNYFGPQRFGRGGSNLDRAAAWARSGLAPRGRNERSFALSAARSLLFNAVLARRVLAHDWSVLAAGDLASLEGSGSHFAVTVVDEALERRQARFDIHPSGPLWGRGEPRVSGSARAHEAAVGGQFTDVTTLLGGAGLEQERRALRCVVRELEVTADAGAITLGFSLGRGQYATAVLREVCDLGAVPDFEPEDA